MGMTVQRDLKVWGTQWKYHARGLKQRGGSHYLNKAYLVWWTCRHRMFGRPKACMGSQKGLDEPMAKRWMGEPEHEPWLRKHRRQQLRQPRFCNGDVLLRTHLPPSFPSPASPCCGLTIRSGRWRVALFNSHVAARSYNLSLLALRSRAWGLAVFLQEKAGTGGSGNNSNLVVLQGLCSRLSQQGCRFASLSWQLQAMKSERKRDWGSKKTFGHVLPQQLFCTMHRLKWVIEKHIPMYSRQPVLQLFLAGNVLRIVVSGGSLVMKCEKENSTVVTYLPGRSETFGTECDSLTAVENP